MIKSLSRPAAFIALLYLFSLPVLIGTVLRLNHVWFGEGGDIRYLAHPVMSTLHLLPGGVFFLLGPMQFARRKARWHRLRGWVFVLSAVISGGAVLAMIFAFPALGGLLTQVSTSAIVLAMFAALALGVRAARARRIVEHRAMMIRAYGLGLTVAAARWLIQAAGIAGVPFETSFVVASAIGAALTVASVELVLRRERRA